MLIACVSFYCLRANLTLAQVFTSSYDCTVRKLSFTSGISTEVFSMEDTLITGIDLPVAGNEMWASDAAGGITHLDLREDKSKARWYQVSDQKVGSQPCCASLSRHCI